MRIKSFTKKALSMLIVAVMMLSVMAPVVSAIGPIENLIKRDEHNNDTLHYVALGASNTNGFGHHGYLPPEVYEDPLAANKAQMNDYGYLKEPANAYPNLIKNALAEATGRDVALHQLAISSMRVEEVLYLIDDSYIPDEYMEWRFTGGKSWFDAAEDGGIPALKEAYTNYITNADVITLDLGWNNFGVYAFNNIMTILKEGGSRYWKAPAFDRVVEAGMEEEYYAIRDKAMARLSELVDLSETALSNEVIEKLVNVLAYAAFGACYNFDKIVEKIYELNPDATVITINIQNLADELVVDLDGMQIPLGDLYGELIELVDFYRANESPYADKYLFAYAGEDGDVDTFLDEFRLWDGDPATLSQDMKDLFDMYDDNLYVRSKIEYIMVGQVFGQIFAKLRSEAKEYGLSAFENDGRYTFEIPEFDMAWLNGIDLTELDFNNPDSGLEYYGAAVSKHLVNLRNYEGEGKNAYNYVFDDLIKKLTSINTLDAAIAQRDYILEALDPAYREAYKDLIQVVSILEEARNTFNAAFLGLYMVYQNTLNYAYDTVGTIIQYSLQFNTFYMTPDSMANHNNKTEELLGYVVNTFTNNTMLKFYEELGKIGLDNSGTVAPEITVNEELFSDPIIQAVAALEVRYDFGNSFFAHPSVKGNQQIKDAVMDVLKNGSHAEKFTDKKIVLYIELLKSYLEGYYEDKFENLDINATVDTTVDILNAISGTMDALEFALVNFEISEDLGIDREAAESIKALAIEEIANVRASANAIRNVLRMNTLELINTDFEAKLLSAHTHLENHLKTLAELTVELGHLADPYVNVALQYANKVMLELGCYIDAVIKCKVDAAVEAYDYLANKVVGFNQKYLRFVELVGAYADKIDENLGKEIRDYLIASPNEALAIIGEYGIDATIKFIVDVANAGNNIYSSVSAIVAVMMQHGEEICRRVANNEEYKTILAKLDAKVDELMELYASLKSNPLYVAIDIDIVLGEHLAELEALYAELIECVMEDVEKYDSEVAELLWTALMDTVESLGILEDAADSYLVWLEGRTDMMVGALLDLFLQSSLELGNAAHAATWKYLNQLNAFLLNATNQINAQIALQIEILKGELEKLENMVDSAIAAKVAEIKAKIAALEAMINAGIEEVEDLVASIEELILEVKALAEKLEADAREALEKIENKLNALKNTLCAIITGSFDEIDVDLNALALDLLERALASLKKAIPEIDKALYDYITNNPEEILNFFREYGPYIEKLAHKYGDEILNVVVYLFNEYGDDVARYIIENPEKILEIACKWYDTYGARVLPLLKAHLDLLGFEIYTVEEIELILAELGENLNTYLQIALEFADSKEAALWKYLEQLEGFLADASGELHAHILLQLEALKYELLELGKDLDEVLTDKIAELVAKVEKLQTMIKAGINDVKTLIAYVEELVAEVEAFAEKLDGEAKEALLNAVEAYNKAKATLCALLVEAREEVAKQLNALCLDLLERLKNAIPEIDKALYDYLMNNPEEVLDFFKTYGPYIEKLAHKYGDEILGVVVYLFNEYGKDAVVNAFETPIKALETICEWYEKYGARVLPLIRVYLEILGVEIYTVEDIEQALVCLMDELNAKLGDLEDEIRAKLNEETLAQINSLLRDIENTLAYAETLAGELKAMAIAEANRMLDELKALVTEIINDALTGEYEANEDSYYVGITGANAGYVELLANALGLGDKFAMMNWYDLDMDLLEKADFVTIGYDYSQIYNFTLVQLLAYTAEFADGSLREQLITFVHEVLDGNMADEYINNYVDRINEAIDQLLENPALAGKQTTELDWAALVGEENVANVKALLEEVKVLLEEQGITGDYVLSIDVAELLAQYDMQFNFLEEGTMLDLRIPVADIVLYTVESYLYANMALEFAYAETIMNLIAMNPDVQIALLGNYTELADLTVAGVKIPMAEISEKLAALASARSFAFALALSNVTYVDIADVELNIGMAHGEMTFEDALQYLANLENTTFTKSGDLYVMNQILNAYNLTCVHVYDGCEDSECNICGEARESAKHNYTSVVTKPTCTTEGYTTHTCSACGESYVDSKTAALGHKYDNACDVDCNVCGEKRTPAEHKFGDWIETKKATETEDGEEKRVCSVCGYEEYRKIILDPVDPVDPIKPVPVILITITISSVIALAGAFFFNKFRK